MTFLVYDKDPFVQADILETLAAAFPNCSVSLLSEIGLLGAVAKASAQPTVAVISASWADVKTQIADLGQRAHDLCLVLIGDEAAGDAEGILATSVQRPFSSDSLLQAVRSVLSARPSSPK